MGPAPGWWYDPPYYDPYYYTAATPVVETGSRAGMGAGPLDLEWVELGLAARLLGLLLSYDAFMKDNHIPVSDTTRVQSAFAKARQERARPNYRIQLEGGQLGGEAVTRSSGRGITR